MEQTISPSAIEGRLQAPASKSVVQRALAAALLSKGTSILNGYTSCDDALAAISIVEKLGAKINFKQAKTLEVTGCSPQNTSDKTELHIECGESGLASRLFTPITMLYANHVLLQGEGSLLKRPFTSVEKPLNQLGVSTKLNNCFLPLQLDGQIKNGTIEVDGKGGSQFLTGLLMCLPLLKGDSIVSVDQLQSKPYIDLTIEVLNKFGICIEHNNYEVFTIKGNQHYRACEYNMEGDWSGASCLLVAGAVAGSIEVTNLDTHSRQADKAIIDALKSAGAYVKQTDNSTFVRKGNLQSFEFDASHCPDLFPALVVLAANCTGISKLTGSNRLVNKESNRALTLQSEFAKLGITIELEDNKMLVHGGKIEGGNCFAHNDHRIAMTLAIAGLTAKKPVRIEGIECVNKSYPDFFNDLQKVNSKN